NGSVYRYSLPSKAASRVYPRSSYLHGQTNSQYSSHFRRTHIHFSSFLGYVSHLRFRKLIRWENTSCWQTVGWKFKGSLTNSKTSDPLSTDATMTPLAWIRHLRTDANPSALV